MPDDILRQFGIDPATLEPLGDYSWAFNSWLVTDNPGIQAIADKLAAPAMQLWNDSKQRIRKDVQNDVASCLQMILLNLIRAAGSDPKLSVGIATGKEALNSSRQYRPTFMSEGAFRAAMDKLVQADVIRKNGVAFHYAGGGQVTRYRLTTTAIETALLELTGHPIERKANLADQFRVSDASETIRLKDKGDNKRRPRLCS